MSERFKGRGKLGCMPESLIEGETYMEVLRQEGGGAKFTIFMMDRNIHMVPSAEVILESNEVANLRALLERANDQNQNA